MTVHKGITIKWENYTPTKAQTILDEQSGHNRALSENRVTRLARSWDNGEFTDTADTVKFDTQDRLIDGQHRLAAIAKQGKARTLLTARGLRPEAIRTIDAEVKPRSWGDVFQIDGYHNAVIVASIARTTLNLEESGHPMPGAKFSASAQAGLEHLERRPEIVEITVPFVIQFRNTLGSVFTMKELGVLYELIREGNPQEAAIFVEELGNGQGVVRTPSYTVYHQVRKAKADPRSVPTFTWVLGVLILAWNDHMSGTTSRTKGYQPKGGAFPLPVGFKAWLSAGGI
jgi:hypothetical protein